MTLDAASGPDPVRELDQALRASIAALVDQAVVAQPGPLGAAGALRRLFDAQASSRHLDAVARELQSVGRGFYTISSAGHESNAAVAMAARPTDPALLHYRSGAFYVARARQLNGMHPTRDILQSLMGAVEEPIAGGRHKVFGHHALSVIPQTSTIASHLPRAVGLAVAIRRAHRLGVATPWPRDAVVVCSLGDASANHSTAAGAINTAINTAFRGIPVPIVFVCEDNGWGISVPTPAGWIESAYGSRPGLAYLGADGADSDDCLATAQEAFDLARSTRTPVFLHLKTVRFLGHAGSDAEVSYRRPTDMTADYARDPILATARSLVARGGATATEILDRYDELRARIDEDLQRLGEVRLLGSATEVMAPLSPRRPEAVAAAATSLAPPTERTPATLAESINSTLADILQADARTVVFGEDVGVKGGVYGATRGLARRFGSGRVFDTLLDEQSILGLALGSGLAGLVPIPEIQYLAYLHNAEDQVRGEAATLSYFSNGQYRNPMVVRIAGLAYQRGFGGHFHNDNAVAVLRDIPGLVIACPARADDAAAMLRTCVAAAAVDGTVSVFLEPIALYHRRDLHTPGDQEWMFADDGQRADIGRGRLHGDGDDLTIVTFGNGLLMSLRAAAQLAARGVGVRVLDLRWLAPLPVDDLIAAASATGRVLIADETRYSGGVGEGVIAALVESGFTGTIKRVASKDSFVPLGSATGHVLLGEHDIIEAATSLAQRL